MGFDRIGSRGKAGPVAPPEDVRLPAERIFHRRTGGRQSLEIIDQCRGRS